MEFIGWFIGWIVSIIVCFDSIANFQESRYYSRDEYEDFLCKSKRILDEGITSFLVSYILFILAFPQTENSAIYYILFCVCLFGGIIIGTSAIVEMNVLRWLLKFLIGTCLALMSVFPLFEYIDEINTKTATFNFTEEMKDKM